MPVVIVGTSVGPNRRERVEEEDVFSIDAAIPTGHRVIHRDAHSRRALNTTLSGAIQESELGISVPTVGITTAEVSRVTLVVNANRTMESTRVQGLEVVTGHLVDGLDRRNLVGLAVVTGSDEGKGQKERKVFHECSKR